MCKLELLTELQLSDGTSNHQPIQMKKFYMKEQTKLTMQDCKYQITIQLQNKLEANHEKSSSKKYKFIQMSKKNKTKTKYLVRFQTLNKIIMNM